MRKGFAKAERNLYTYLNDSKKQIEGIYKDLSMADKEDRHNLVGGSKGNNLIDSASGQTQLIEVTIEMLRCVKDKIPKGRYCILCSIVDRMGGNVIDLQQKQRKFRRLTIPVVHSGEYHLNSLRFHCSLNIIAPSHSNVRPSMAWLFELFLLKSKEYTHDQVLGWGVFPLVDSEFEINRGNYKVIFVSEFF